MTFTKVNIGSSANDGTGDPLRNAFDELNNNLDLTAPTLDNSKTIYFAENGDDSLNNGLSTNKPVKNLSTAITKASLLNPTPGNPVVIRSFDSSIITGNFELLDDIFLIAPAVTIITNTANPALKIGSRVLLDIGATHVNFVGGTGLLISGTSYARINNINLFQSGIGIDFDETALFGEVQVLSGIAANGVGIKNRSLLPGQLRVDIGTLVTTTNNSIGVLHESPFNLTTLESGLIQNSIGPTGTKGIQSTTGQIRCYISTITVPVAIETNAAVNPDPKGQVFIFSTVINGDIVNNGSVDARILSFMSGAISGSGSFMGEISNRVYGDRIFNNGIQFDSGTIITEFDIDGTFASPSDNVVATQLASKTYIDSEISILESEVDKLKNWTIIPVTTNYTLTNLSNIILSVLSTIDHTRVITIDNGSTWGLNSNTISKFIIENSGDYFIKIVSSDGNFQGTSNSEIWLQPRETREFYLSYDGTTYRNHIIGGICYQFSVKSTILQENQNVGNWVLSSDYVNSIPTDLFEIPAGNNDRLLFKQSGSVRQNFEISWHWIDMSDNHKSVNLSAVVSKNAIIESTSSETALMKINDHKSHFSTEFENIPVILNDYLTISAPNLVSGDSEGVNPIVHINYEIKQT